MAGRTHRSIVSTKYGDRPLIDVPPISFPQRVSYQQNIQNPRYQMGNLADDLNLPPNAHQTVTPMYPQQNHAQPSYGYRPNLNPYGNVIQNSNVIPYQSAPVPSYPYQNGGPPAYQQPYQNGGPPAYQQPYQNGGPPAYQQPYQNEGYPSTNQGLQGPSGETHHFYGPHGEKIPAPILNSNFGFHNQMRYPTNFKIKGKLKRGQMTSIEVVESNISYRDLPDAVIKDLKRLYGHIDKADVTIIAESGEYHIYATPKQNGVPQVNPGYHYETRSRGGSNTADHFTKKYHQTDDVMYKFDPNAKTYYVDPRSYSVASEGRRPREYKVTEEPRLPVPKPVRRDF